MDKIEIKGYKSIKDMELPLKSVNILMFLPLGLLLAIWERQNHFPVYLLTVALSVCLLEAAQYLTRLGSADVDDLLLNLLGASLGFLIWKWISRAKAA